MARLAQPQRVGLQGHPPAERHAGLLQLGQPRSRLNGDTTGAGFGGVSGPFPVTGVTASAWDRRAGGLIRPTGQEDG